MKIPAKVTNQLNWLSSANLLYGAVGLVLFTHFSGHGAWKSFLAGWLMMVVNLELLKKIGSALFVVYEGGNLQPIFYLFLLGKFLFWGAVLAMLLTATWIQGIPFAFGTVTLLVACGSLGMKELIYAQ
ncbi:MAG: hypothetical protein HY074_08535 [Deltaproteobacteria bacterium]|nr:hypothetical protein [Deltaproteobacteria bacterium]